MYLYVIFGILAVMAFFDVLIEKEHRGKLYGVIFTFAALGLFFLSAFRFERGGDWLVYQGYYQHSSNWNFEGWLEWGYTFLNKILNLISNDFSLMVFVMAAIIYSIKPRVIYKLAPYPFFALLTWYAISIADIFPTRQFIASAFVLYSLLFVIKRQFWPFLFFVILAASFHLTALIFVIVYFIYPIRISRFWALAAFVGSFVVGFMGESFIANLLGGISNPIIQERIESYLEQGSDNTFGMIYSTRDVLIRGFINRGLIMGVVLFLLNYKRVEDKVFNGLVNMFIFSSVCFAILTTVNVALGRLVSYFDLAQIFIFSYLFTINMDRRNRMIIFVVVVLYFVYRFVGVVNNYYDLYVPYKSLFWNSDLPVILY